MCGRYTLRKFPAAVALSSENNLEIIEASSAVDGYEPRFNIAPTQSNFVLTLSPSQQALEARKMHWGLVPSWSKTPQTLSPLINARHETAAQKPSFKAAWQRRRCLVPADGFYEWKKTRSGSKPYFFHLRDDSVFYMAGIWETWHGTARESISSYTILTTQANKLLAKYHDRMPAILRRSDIAAWLEAPPSEASFFEPFDAQEMEVQAANPSVSNTKNEGPGCLEELPEQTQSQLEMGF